MTLRGRGPAHRWTGVAFDALLIAAATVLHIVPLPGGWIENAYANGVYAGLARTFVPLANTVSFAIGDVLLVAIVAAIVVYTVARLVTAGGRRMRTLARVMLRVAAVLAAIAIWFDLAWALNYRRAPVIARIAYDPARIAPAHVSTFSRALIADLNAAAPLAHARSEPWPVTEAALARAFAPVVERLGDRWDVIVSRPKTTIFERWFETAGIGGQWDPFAYETVVNDAFLPFERPFAVAHEWGHVAGFGDESDANLIGALTCLRSDDPLVRYSGLFWAYGFLPEADRAATRVTPLVAADLNAARQRFLAHYDPRVYALQWFVYDKYLRANRVSAGVVSYSLFVRVLVGTPLDAQGLPLRR